MEKNKDTLKWGCRGNELGFKKRYLNRKKTSSLEYNDKTKAIIITIDENAPDDMKQSARMTMWRELKEIMHTVPNKPEICVLDLIPIRCKKGGGLQGRLEYHAFVKEKPTDEQYEAVVQFLHIHFVL